MCSVLRVPVTSRAAAFWTDCSRWSWLSAMPYSTELQYGIADCVCNIRVPKWIHNVSEEVLVWCKSINDEQWTDPMRARRRARWPATSTHSPASRTTLLSRRSMSAGAGMWSSLTSLTRAFNSDHSTPDTQDQSPASQSTVATNDQRTAYNILYTI